MKLYKIPTTCISLSPKKLFLIAIILDGSHLIVQAKGSHFPNSTVKNLIVELFLLMGDSDTWEKCLARCGNLLNYSETDKPLDPNYDRLFRCMDLCIRSESQIIQLKTTDPVKFIHFKKSFIGN
jgi:hypothetical protein